MSKKHINETELSRPVRIEKISPNGHDEVITTSERERKELAERFGLVGVSRLEARMKIMPESAGMDFHVTGDFVAEVVQSCIVTLEPLPAHIEQKIDVHFTTAARDEAGAIEHDTDEDDLEMIENGIIDLGELVAQHLALALDPYPRKAGLPPLEAKFGKPVKKESPFAKLVDLKKKSDD